jgi:hypothetical protein
MKPLIKLKTTTLLVIPLVLAGFALLPRAQAETISPLVFAELPGFNTAAGFNALDSLGAGIFNSGFGALALEDTTSGSHNTALGAQALRNNLTGSFNTAVGENALVFNTSGGQNMALGQGALAKNLTGSFNTAMGFQALNFNTASDNTAVGWRALAKNTTGGAPSGAFLSGFQVGPNTAVGTLSLASNIDGGSNTAVGYFALGSMVSGFLSASNTTKGGYSTAVGFEALASAVGSANGDGTVNDAFGYQALRNLTTGENNVGIGAFALDHNTAGNANVAIGTAAGASISGDRNICIGAGVDGTAGQSNTIRIGNTQTATFIAGISGVNQGGAGILPVQINNEGRLGTTASARRFKKEIKPMDQTSEAILGLKPATFHYKDDATSTPQFGLIAEEVAEINPDLVVRNADGEIYSVRYDAVNAMLLNEFLKEHRTVQEQQKEIDALKGELKEQRALIQRVSDKVELSRPAPQVAENNP